MGTLKGCCWLRASSSTASAADYAIDEHLAVSAGYQGLKLSGTVSFDGTDAVVTLKRLLFSAVGQHLVDSPPPQERIARLPCCGPEGSLVDPAER